MKFVLLLIVSSFAGQGILGQQVAFQAQFSSGYIIVPASGPHIFNNVIFNRGNAYSCSTGKFTAPAPGVYYFESQVFTANKMRAKVDIKRNGTPVSTMALNTTQPGDAESVSTGITLQLAANDQVWVETANPLYDIRYLGEMHSHFSGFRVCGC